jgi:hypothetical protein
MLSLRGQPCPVGRCGSGPLECRLGGGTGHGGRAGRGVSPRPAVSVVSDRAACRCALRAGRCPPSPQVRAPLGGRQLPESLGSWPRVRRGAHRSGLRERDLCLAPLRRVVRAGVPNRLLNTPVRHSLRVTGSSPGRHGRTPTHYRMIMGGWLSAEDQRIASDENQRGSAARYP